MGCYVTWLVRIRCTRGRGKQPNQPSASSPTLAVARRTPPKPSLARRNLGRPRRPGADARGRSSSGPRRNPLPRPPPPSAPPPFVVATTAVLAASTTIVQTSLGRCRGSGRATNPSQRISRPAALPGAPIQRHMFSTDPLDPLPPLILLFHRGLPWMLDSAIPHLQYGSASSPGALAADGHR
ncbi:hypothetical protein VPH35_117241 [Triticum aestivum]